MAPKHSSHCHSIKWLQPGNIEKLKVWQEHVCHCVIVRKDWVDYPLNHKVYYDWVFLFNANLGILWCRNMFQVGPVITTFWHGPSVKSGLGFKLGTSWVIGIWHFCFNQSQSYLHLSFGIYLQISEISCWSQWCHTSQHNNSFQSYWHICINQSQNCLHLSVLSIQQCPHIYADCI